MYSVATSTPDMPQNSLWTAVWLGLLLGLLALGVFATLDITKGAPPGDEELRTNYLAHAGAFNDLVHELARDYPANTSKQSKAIDPVTAVELNTNMPRLGIYGRLLRRISVADLRYFPRSGKLILVPDGEGDTDRPSRFYVYLPHAQPQGFTEHHAYAWRAPGVTTVTGDLPLTAGWFIRHDTAVEVAVPPY